MKGINFGRGKESLSCPRASVSYQLWIEKFWKGEGWGETTIRWHFWVTWSNSGCYLVLVPTYKIWANPSILGEIMAYFSQNPRWRSSASCFFQNWCL